jgi:hypothetical protein
MQRYVCSLIRLLAVLSILVVTGTSWAQGVTGSAVTGTVTEDGSGTPIAGAFIELKNAATGDT